MNEPVLTEVLAGIVTEWHCSPPPWNSWYRVVSEQWTGDTRKIYAWQHSPHHRPAPHRICCGDFTLTVVTTW